MTPHALLRARQDLLAATAQRLAALEQERAQLRDNVLRLEGAVEALQTLADASAAPDVPAVDPQGDHTPAAILEPSPVALPWERS